MKSLAWLTIAMLSLSSPIALQADPHGHIIHRDQEGHCSEDDDSDDDDEYDCDDDSDGHEHAWIRHTQREIEPGFEEEDLSYEVDHDASWPSKRENFSEMFR